MSRSKELVKNTAILTIGKMCTQFVSFLLLPLYTALLSTEEYGIVDLFTTYIACVAPIVTYCATLTFLIVMCRLKSLLVKNNQRK